MQLHEIACSYMSLHAVPLACMQLQELSCSSMSLHAVQRACVQFLSLSEQITRISQCLFTRYCIRAYFEMMHQYPNKTAAETVDLNVRKIRRTYLRHGHLNPPGNLESHAL